MLKFKKLRAGFFWLKNFQGKSQKHIKNSEFWLAESKHHKLPTPDRSVRICPSTNHFLRIAASLDPYPTWAEPEAWTCEEKRTAGSAGTMSLHAKWSEEKMPWRVADSSRYPAWLKIVWRFYFYLILKQDISELCEQHRFCQIVRFVWNLRKMKLSKYSVLCEKYERKWIKTALSSRLKIKYKKGDKNLRLPWVVVVVPFNGRKEVNSTGTRVGETGLSVLVLLLVHSGEAERHRLDRSAMRAFL